MADYRLTCINSSNLHGFFAVYQIPPKSDSAGHILSLAWLARPAAPGTRVTFSWSTEMSFVWGEHGVINRRSAFSACQELVGDSERENLVDLTIDSFGAPTFQNLRTGGQQGGMTIRQLNAHFDFPVHIGIAIGGVPAFTADFNPNISTTFIPHRDRYWVLFGGYSAGETIDIAKVSQSVQLDFNPTVQFQTVDIGPDNLIRRVPKGSA